MRIEEFSLGVILFLILSTPLALAEDDTEYPGMLPTHPFYGLKLFGERVQMTFTFNQTRKVEMNMKFARKRLLEAQEMAKMNKTETMEKVMARYQDHVQNAEQQMEKVKERKRQRNMTTKGVEKILEEEMGKNIQVLERVMENAPEAAKFGLQNALDNTIANRDRIRESITEHTNKTETSGKWGGQEEGEEGGELPGQAGQGESGGGPEVNTTPAQGEGAVGQTTVAQNQGNSSNNPGGCPVCD